MMKEASHGTRQSGWNVFQNVDGILDEPANDLLPNAEEALPARVRMSIETNRVASSETNVKGKDLTPNPLRSISKKVQK